MKLSMKFVCLFFISYVTTVLAQNYHNQYKYRIQERLSQQEYLVCISKAKYYYPPDEIITNSLARKGGFQGSVVRVKQTPIFVGWDEIEVAYIKINDLFNINEIVKGCELNLNRDILTKMDGSYTDKFGRMYKKYLYENKDKDGTVAKLHQELADLKKERRSLKNRINSLKEEIKALELRIPKTDIRRESSKLSRSPFRNFEHDKCELKEKERKLHELTFKLYDLDSRISHKKNEISNIESLN